MFRTIEKASHGTYRHFRPIDGKDRNCKSPRPVPDDFTWQFSSIDCRALGVFFRCPEDVYMVQLHAGANASAETA